MILRGDRIGLCQVIASSMRSPTALSGSAIVFGRDELRIFDSHAFVSCLASGSEAVINPRRPVAAKLLLCIGGLLVRDWALPRTRVMLT